VKARLSNIAAGYYLTKYPMAIAVKYRTGRTHLMEEGRPECGALLAHGGELVQMSEENIRWCYSCIGNAIERMETE
jgi:hypothetical protein